MASVNGESPDNFLFLQASDHNDHTGKTYLTNLLLAKIRLGGNVALAVASSGIVATLLLGSQTAHSCFKLPLNLVTNPEPTCNIRKNSSLADVLRAAKLIVWDEISMAHRGGLEALDRSLRDIRNCDKMFGGVTVLICGDFQQILPVVTKGTPADELKACVKSSPLWNKVSVMTLRRNMRVHITGNPEGGRWAAKLLQLGQGNIPTKADDEIDLTTLGVNIVNSGQELQSKIYPNLEENYKKSDWLRDRAILAPRNDIVEQIKASLMERVPGESVVYRSYDQTTELSEACSYPMEFLNSLNPPGLPPHQLTLKEGCPIILLRNLDAPRLMNGTSLIVKCLMRNVIVATILTGVAEREDVLIPWISQIPSDFFVEFKRMQFPVKPAFCLTVNKSQGQTMKYAGLHLNPGVFSHGQMYVGCCRCGSPENHYIYANGTRAKNIVYQQVIR